MADYGFRRAKVCPNEKQKDPSHKQGGADLGFAAEETRRLVKSFACAAVLSAGLQC